MHDVRTDEAGDQHIKNQPSRTGPLLPVVWTVAGSDSGGGAGIQADLKTLHAFGVVGCSAITAVTAQNTVDVTAVECMPPSLIMAQLEALQDDLPAAAVKIGMLGNAAACRAVAAFFRRFHPKGTSSAAAPVLVCDPVLRSSSGRVLLEEAREILLQELFPVMDVLTPNVPETELLTGQPFQRPEAAAEQLLETGARSVLIKGGHAGGGTCRDYWTDGTDSVWLSSPRIPVSAAHGTGCILSSAIAAAVSLGQPLPEAVVTAKTFVNQCLKSPAGPGKGQALLWIARFEDRPEDRPDVSR